MVFIIVAFVGYGILTSDESTKSRNLPATEPVSNTEEQEVVLSSDESTRDKNAPLVEATPVLDEQEVVLSSDESMRDQNAPVVEMAPIPAEQEVVISSDESSKDQNAPVVEMASIPDEQEVVPNSDESINDQNAPVVETAPAPDEQEVALIRAANSKGKLDLDSEFESGVIDQDVKIISEDAPENQQLSTLEPTNSPVGQVVQPKNNAESSLSVSVAESSLPSQNTVSPLVFNVLAIFSFVALAVSLWVNVFLLKWRRKVNTADLSIVPSVLMDKFADQTHALSQLTKEHGRALEMLGKELSRIFGGLQHESSESRQSSADLLEAFAGLQSALNDKDQEIKRLRSGYDSEIFRRFLNRFVRLEKIVREEIEDLPKDNETGREALSQIQILLSDALAECGLNEFTPNLGESIRNAEGVDENHKTKPAKEPGQILTIAEVLEPGLRISTPDGGFEYVKKARVVVYVENEEAA